MPGPAILAVPAWWAARWAAQQVGRAVVTRVTQSAATRAATNAIISEAVREGDEGAEGDLEGTRDVTTTCTGCPPDPNSECGRLYQEIEALTQELASRRAAMLADRSVSQGGLGMYDLYLRDPDAKVADPRGIRPDLGNWRGHQTQILQKQQNLRSKIAEFRAKGCSPLPIGAETQADLPPPTSPF